MMVTSVIDERRQDLTYNFTVADFHTYYVTERKVLVHNCNIAKGIDDVISSASRPARAGSQDSRALQALKKKIDRGDDAFSGLPKTQDAANDLIRQTLEAKNPVVRTKTRNGQTVRDVFDPSTGRGIRTIDGELDTFVNL